MSRREQAESAMFDLKFFETVKRCLHWTESPISKVLNEHESFLASKRQGRFMNHVDPHDFSGTPDSTRELQKYVGETYAPYFGLSMRVGKAATHWNHTINESY